MQTFLPEYSFDACAEVLDTKRLVKQLLEGRQILQTLVGESEGWKAHPAVKMWVGYEKTLYSYLRAIRNEMERRGYKWENNWAVIERIYNRYLKDELQPTPYWMIDPVAYEKVIMTHRGRLWEKDGSHYAHYSTEGGNFKDLVCCERCTYYWPSHRISKWEEIMQQQAVSLKSDINEEEFWPSAAI